MELVRIRIWSINCQKLIENIERFPMMKNIHLVSFRSIFCNPVAKIFQAVSNTRRLKSSQRSQLTGDLNDFLKPQDREAIECLFRDVQPDVFNFWGLGWFKFQGNFCLKARYLNR